ncbi:hypothetical protein APHAL10511_000004, partial [Amanita phalloides]
MDTDPPLRYLNLPMLFYVPATHARRPNRYPEPPKILLFDRMPFKRSSTSPSARPLTWATLVTTPRRGIQSRLTRDMQVSHGIGANGRIKEAEILC